MEVSSSKRKQILLGVGSWSGEGEIGERAGRQITQISDKYTE